MATTDKQIEKARELAKLIEGIKGIAGCVVDDWKDSGFTLFASIKGTKDRGSHFWPEGGDDYNLRTVVSQIRKITKGYVNYVKGPARKYSHAYRANTRGANGFIGYENSLIDIDLYIPED